MIARFLLLSADGMHTFGVVASQIFAPRSKNFKLRWITFNNKNNKREAHSGGV